VHTLFDTADAAAGTIRLRGDLDKIEFLSETRVNVVDYKTGKPKSRNQIEGKTKSSNGNYKRQLVFYKLLMQLYQNGTYTMASGEIDFVEPDDRGRYRKERFEITQEEVDELKQTIAATAKEIYDLAFWNTRCGEKNCRYCALRDMMER
jgi:DNA helicase-2/ATP-dependent DNA helicase PcrA